MFQVITEPVRRMWYHVDANSGSFDTLYVGQLVKALTGSDGVAPLGSASGAADTTTEAVPFGVVTGVNLRSPLHSTTSNSIYITSASPHANTTERITGLGQYSFAGETAAMVEVALIDEHSILKGDIRNGGINTAITVGTVTTASTSGAGFACSAGLCDFTPVDAICSVYCRSGANQGIYRITSDASAVTKTTDLYFPYDIALGDTFVGVPMRTVGRSFVQTDTESLYLNAGASPATDYWVAEIIELHLETPGQEYALFRFNGVHFIVTRS